MLKMRITHDSPLKHTGDLSEFFISNLISTMCVNVGLHACPSAHASIADPRAFVRGFSFVSLSYAQVRLLPTSPAHYYDYRSSVRGAEVLVHPQLVIKSGGFLSWGVGGGGPKLFAL